LEVLQWDVLPHPLYQPVIPPSDYHLFGSMPHGLAEQEFGFLRKSQKTGIFFDCPKKREIFSPRNRYAD